MSVRERRGAPWAVDPAPRSWVGLESWASRGWAGLGSTDVFAILGPNELMDGLVMKAVCAEHLPR